MVDEAEYEAAGVPPSGGHAPNGATEKVRPFTEGQTFENISTELLALQSIAKSLVDMGDRGRVPPEPLVLAKHRFRILCMEVFGVLPDENPAMRLAEVLIGGVYSGHIGYKRLRERVDGNEQLSDEEKALCLGLCAGFMVDFLPRVRG